MSGSLVRVCVTAGQDSTADLVLPTAPAVGELLPSIVRLVGVQPGAWQLWRPDGQRMDDSISLQRNMISDGDLLVLLPTTLPPPPVRRPDAFELTAHHAPASRADTVPGRVVFCWSIALAALLVCAPGGTPAGAVIAAVGCLAAVVAVGRVVGELPPLLAGAAITFGAVAGFLAVPSPPSAPNVLLAAAVGATVAWMLIRLYPAALTVGTAALGLCIPMALAAAAAVVRPLPWPALGAGLAAAGWTLLTIAPRLSVFGAGLTPDSAEPDRVDRTHRMLTGLVFGASATAFTGAVASAFGAHDGVAGPAFTLLLAASLLIRSITFRHPTLRRCTMGAGLLCATVAFIAAADTFPNWTRWLALGLPAVGLIALRTGIPSATRTTARADLATSVVLVPAALWLTGAYQAVQRW